MLLSMEYNEINEVRIN